MRQEHIRRLFLEPQPTYSIAEAAELLEMGWRDVRAWIESGELEASDSDHGFVLPWEELVSFAMGFWEQEEIESALGENLARAIPELLRLADLEVRIPRLEVMALEHVAARDATSVDTVLARELLDFISANSEWLSHEIPGFAQALRWPLG